MFTPNQEPPVQEIQTLEVTHTIAQLAAMYEVGKPWVIDQDIVIGGKVSTNDQPGNFYKSLYRGRYRWNGNQDRP